MTFGRSSTRYPLGAEGVATALWPVLSLATLLAGLRPMFLGCWLALGAERDSAEGVSEGP